MATVTFKGTPVKTSGELPRVGSKAPDFVLTGADLSDVKLSDYAGRPVVLNIFPSIDTPVCAVSVRRFNKEAAACGDAVVLCISVDLPFAQGRFCAAEGIENVKTASAFRSHTFGGDYGVMLTDSVLAGLLARAVLVVGRDGRVTHSELVPEIAQEPDYAAALAALKL
jgi:thiol peroxidase